MYVLKIGGRQLDNPMFLDALGHTVAQVRREHPVVLVHGGGKTIQAWQERLGITPHYVEGLRVTDEASLEVVEAVLAGLVNKRLVALLQRAGVDAVGLSGVDGGLVRVTKMKHPHGDLGRVGEVAEVHTAPLTALLDAGFTPVVAPVSLGRDFLTYNVNADHVARAVAAALHADRLYFISDVPGVLINGRPVSTLTVHQAEAWIAEGHIHGGMIPKVRSAIAAVESGVHAAVITNLEGLATSGGTVILKPS